jgi:hypothetical protein
MKCKVYAVKSFVDFRIPDIVLATIHDLKVDVELKHQRLLGQKVRQLDLALSSQVTLSNRQRMTLNCIN